jgi:antitoxin Phd
MVGWALQDAKGKFSELVDSARTKGPQLVTRRGKEAVVVVAVEQFRQFVRKRGEEGLVDFFRNSPLAELDSKSFERNRDPGRTVPL